MSKSVIKGQGVSFEQWRFELSCAINELGRVAYLDQATLPMFDCNYDSTVAAREWLRRRLEKAP